MFIEFANCVLNLKSVILFTDKMHLTSMPDAQNKYIVAARMSSFDLIENYDTRDDVEDRMNEISVLLKIKGLIA